MKKVLLFSIAILLYISSAIAQNIDSIQIYISQGVSLHDNGDYVGAISSYDKALALDKNNVTALAEKAFAFMLLREYKNAIRICQKAIKKNPNADGLRVVYLTYANALDASNKPKEAIKMYDEGIRFFPDFYQLHFNKGITLSGLEEYEESLLSFQRAVALNPQHASSHNALGRILSIGNNDIDVLLILCRFLVIEPQGRRAKSNLPFIQKIMFENVEKTGENNITISLDENMLSNMGKDEKKENDFSLTYLMLSLTSALDFEDENKGKTEVQLFMNKFETVCASLKETQSDNSGFYWDYYVPYYIEMKDKDMIETFSYLVYASSEDEDVLEWLSENETKIELFYEWSSDYEW